MKHLRKIALGTLGIIGITTITGNTDAGATPNNTLDLSDVRVADSCVANVDTEIHASDDGDTILFAGCGGVS